MSAQVDLFAAPAPHELVRNLDLELLARGWVLPVAAQIDAPILARMQLQPSHLWWETGCPLATLVLVDVMPTHAGLEIGAVCVGFAPLRVERGELDFGPLVTSFALRASGHTLKMPYNPGHIVGREGAEVAMYRAELEHGATPEDLDAALRGLHDDRCATVTAVMEVCS